MHLVNSVILILTGFPALLESAAADRGNRDDLFASLIWDMKDECARRCTFLDRLPPKRFSFANLTREELCLDEKFVVTPWINYSFRCIVDKCKIAGTAQEAAYESYKFGKRVCKGITNCPKLKDGHCRKGEMTMGKVPKDPDGDTPGQFAVVSTDDESGVLAGDLQNENAFPLWFGYGSIKMDEE